MRVPRSRLFPAQMSQAPGGGEWLHRRGTAEADAACSFSAGCFLATSDLARLGASDLIGGS